MGTKTQVKGQQTNSLYMVRRYLGHRVVIHASAQGFTGVWQIRCYRDDKLVDSRETTNPFEDGRRCPMLDDFCRDCGHYIHACSCTDHRTDTPRSSEEVEAMEREDQRLWDESGPGYEYYGQWKDADDADHEGHIRQLTHRLLGEFAGERARGHFEQRAREIRAEVERCPHGHLRRDCADCSARDRMRYSHRGAA